ncbi:MAG TPA: PilZ domain-containing protein [Kofleriaceae bacterium]|nr:PilZ domain-containing protein [Kofleriaceae bacterium]
MTMMQDSDRRFGLRIPVDVFVTHYIKDRPYRALAVNLSPSGVFVHRARLPRVTRDRRNRYALVSPEAIGLELSLPGLGESIWARGEICYETPGQLVSGAGIRFTGIPRVHTRLLRDYCFETRRTQLSRMLPRPRA